MFNWFREIKYFIQRGMRGYSDRDLWDLGDHLMVMIPPSVRQLAKYTSGCPGDLWDKEAKNNECHKWNEILEEIAQGFEAAEQIKSMRRYCKWLKTPEGLYDHVLEKEKDKQLAEKYERGMELFDKYFLGLWD
jgi:hypothetical protein